MTRRELIESREYLKTTIDVLLSGGSEELNIGSNKKPILYKWWIKEFAKKSTQTQSKAEYAELFADKLRDWGMAGKKSTTYEEQIKAALYDAIMPNNDVFNTDLQPAL